MERVWPSQETTPKDTTIPIYFQGKRCEKEIEGSSVDLETDSRLVEMGWGEEEYRLCCTGFRRGRDFLAVPTPLGERSLLICTGEDWMWSTL